MLSFFNFNLKNNYGGLTTAPWADAVAGPVRPLQQ